MGFIRSFVCFFFPVIKSDDTCASDSGRSKLLSKTAGISRYQNPNIYTPEESSQ